MSSGAKADEFRAFAFDSNEAWLAYLRNIELPATDAAAALQRLKARWYKRNIDPDFDVDSVAAAPSNPRTEPQSAPPPPSTSASRPAPAPRAAGPSAWGAGGSGTSGSSSSHASNSQQQYVMILQCAMLVCTLFHLVPVLPISSCSLQCYRWFMRLAVVSQGYKVYLKFGTPPVWPFNWPQLQVWLSRAMSSTDFFYAIVSFAFMGTNMALTLAMVPVLLSSTLNILAVGSQQFGTTSWWRMTGARAHAWTSSRPAFMHQVSTWAELALGFLLIVLLVTPARNFLLLFFYWNMLKMRYVTPESAADHRMAWAYLDHRTQPYRQRVPIVEKGLQYIKAWFLNVQT